MTDPQDKRYVHIGDLARCRDCGEQMSWPFGAMLHEIRHHSGWWPW